MSKKVWTFIIGILLIVGGLVLFIEPEQSFAKLVSFIGIILIVTGVIKVVYAFVSRNSLLMPGNVFMGGFLNSIFGLIFLFNPDVTVKVISIFIGLWFISTALSSLVLVLNIKSRDSFSQSMLVTNIIKLIIGIVVLTTPIISVLFTGIFLGICLIVIGVFVLLSAKSDEKVYKVRVKK